MSKRVRSLIASVMLIAMLMGMLPATELTSVFAASCKDAGYSGGNENPFQQGTTLGVDYTVAAGYYSTGKNAATAAMQEWGQKDANRYPVDPDATEVTRSIVAATSGSPMYLHHTGTSKSGNNMSRAYGWVSNFAKDDGRYYSADDVRYLVMVYRTPGRTSGGSDMQAYWAVSKSGSYAEDYDWFVNTRGMDGIDISDLCYDNYLKPDSGLTDFGWMAEGVHSTGILSSMSFHVTCSGEWTYAVIDMMKNSYGATGIGGTYYNFYDTFAADGNSDTNALIAKNTKYLNGDCVAGVGLALPINGNGQTLDISHVAYFSTEDAAKTFGESAVAFDNNPGTYSGDTVSLSQTTVHQAPTVSDQYLATFVPTNTWGTQSSVIDGTWTPQNYYSQQFNYALTIESAQVAVENVNYGGVPSRRIYAAPDSEWRWPTLDVFAKTNLSGGAYDGKWLTTDPRNLSDYEGTDKSSNAGTDIRYIRYITLVYETLSIDDTDIGIGFRRYESDSNDQRVGFWNSSYKGGTDSTFWLDFPESSGNQTSSGSYASPNYQVVTYDLLEWVEKYGKTSLESFNSTMWKFNGISLSFNGMDQSYSYYYDSVCVAYCDFFTEESEAQLHGQRVQEYLNSYSTSTMNSIVNTVTYTADSDYAHSYNKVVTQPTCTEGGYTTYTCRDCGYSYVSDKTSALGHNSVATVTAPTCTQAGYTTYTCSRCGDTYTGNPVNPNGHKYSGGQNCTVCGKEKSFEGLKLSILGDSISTYMGVSNNTDYNSTIGDNNVHYDGTNYNPNVKLSDTWWMQTIDTLGMRLLVNNSWSGSKIWKWAWYTDGAYVDRCVQLHNNEGEVPDIVAIFLGTNDFIGQADGALGSASAINYSTLIKKSGSTYTYATPTTVCEAYAIMVHKAMIRYPNAEFYCFTILPSRKYIDESIGGLEDFNNSIMAIAEHFGAYTVDLYGQSGIEIDDGRVFDKNHWYTSHETVHPDPGGMDAITNTFLSSLYTNSQYNVKETSNVTYNLADDVIVKEGNAYAVLKGESFTCSFMSLTGKGAQATVTMGGKNITAEVYSNGVITIPEVTGDIVITAKEGTPHSYELVVTDPTCTVGGNTSYVCSNCGDSYVISTTQATGHSYSSKVTAATCTAQGYTTYTCAGCGNSYTNNYVTALGHIDANTDHKCDRNCGKTDMGTHADSATDKDHVCDYGCGVKLESCSDKSGDGDHKCDICGATDVTSHSYGSASCDKPATCSECGATTGSALGHIDANTDHKCDRNCGKTDMGTHADSATDGDHVCDYGCGAVLESCSDKTGDGNHNCDICNAANVTSHSYGSASCEKPATCSECGATTGSALGHIDANTDHKCDRNCGKTDMGTHADSATDGDHVCDYGCGAVLESCSDKTGDGNHNCDICNASDVTEHSYGDASCDEPATCNECGASTGSALGHGYKGVVTAPTCTAEGYTTYTCTRCGHSYVGDKVNAKGHTWVDATCTDAKYCSVCKVKDGNALGHNYKGVVTAPTCTAEGYTTYTCQRCKHSYVDNKVSAKGHSWVAATCTDAKYCSVCKVTEGNALGHTWVDATCTDAKYCSVCKVTEGNALGHDHKGVVTAPGCTTEGYTTYTCSRCGDSYVGNKVSAKGHTWAEGVCSVCGQVCGHTSITGRVCDTCGMEFAAKIGNTYYKTFTQATEAANGMQNAQITVLADVTVTGNVNCGNAALTVNSGVTMTVEGQLTAAAVTNNGGWAGDGFVTVGGVEYKVFNNALYLFAGEADEDWEIWNVTVPTYWTAGEGYAAFDPENSVLTLHDASIYAKCFSSDDSAVEYEKDLIINFSGSSTLTTNDHNQASFFYIKGATVMNGVGENAVLSILGGNSLYGAVAAVFGSLTVNGGTVNVTAGNGESSSGLTSDSVTVAQGAVLNVKGGNASESYSSGMLVGDLTVEGTLNASSGVSPEKSINGDVIVLGTLADSGTINGLVMCLDQNNLTLNYTAYGNTTLNYDRVISAMEGATTFFTVPAGSTLTVGQGVTLDLSGLETENVVLEGTVIENGTIILPSDECEHIDSDQNIRCDICNELMKPAHLRSLSLSLVGKIGINYYMLLSDQVLADSTAYMQFRLVDGEVIRIPVDQGVMKEYGGETYYVFTCYVSAKEMADDVVSQFFYAGGSTEPATFNVKYYAEETLRTSNDEDLKNLIRTMLNYGAAAQNNFGYNTDNLAGEALDYSDVTISGYDINVNQGTALAEFYAASLILKSSTTLRFFFLVDESVENFTATYNGQQLTVSQRGGLYYVDVVGIAAQDLGKDVTITISDGSTQADVSFNPMAYCQGVNNDTTGDFDQNLKNLVAALYLYNQAAIKYFN